MTTDLNPDSLSGAERRQHPRYDCDGYAEVVVFDPPYLFRGKIRDISVTGCFIETPARIGLPRRAKVELRFSADGEHLAFLAFVMSVHPGDGFGFQFVAGDPRLDKSFFALIDRLSQRDAAA